MIRAFSNENVIHVNTITTVRNANRSCTLTVLINFMVELFSLNRNQHKLLASGVGLYSSTMHEVLVCFSLEREREMVRMNAAHICAGIFPVLGNGFSAGRVGICHSTRSWPHRWKWIIRLENNLFSYIIYGPAALNSLLVCIYNTQPLPTQIYTYITLLYGWSSSF